MRYQIVIRDQNGWGGFAVDYCEIPRLVRIMAGEGYELNGYENNPRLRDELQGQPVFRGLIGPMYNGEGCVRYENQAAYNAMSN